RRRVARPPADLLHGRHLFTRGGGDPVDGAPPIDLGHALWQHRRGRRGRCVTRVDGPIGDRLSSGRHGMNVRLTGSKLGLLMRLAFFESGTPAAAQSDPPRTPRPAPVKVKQGMANVPALSPLWLLPAEAAKYNVRWSRCCSSASPTSARPSPRVISTS